MEDFCGLSKIDPVHLNMGYFNKLFQLRGCWFKAVSPPNIWYPAIVKIILIELQYLSSYNCTPPIKRGKGKSPKIGGPNGKTIRQKGDCPIAKKLM